MCPHRARLARWRAFGTASGSAAHDEASLLGDALAAFNEGETETPHCD